MKHVVVAQVWTEIETAIINGAAVVLLPPGHHNQQRRVKGQPNHPLVMPVDYETPTVYVRPDVESSEEFKALGLKQSGRFVPESRAKIIYGGYDFDGSLEDARAQMERLLDQLGRGRKPRIR